MRSNELRSRPQVRKAMSDETHDQNQGLETPDTAPSRGRVIALAILTYAVVACVGYVFIYQLGAAVNLDALIGGEEPIAVLPEESVFDRAIYLAPAENRLLTLDQIRFANLEVVTDQVELATALGVYPNTEIIFVDPRKIDSAEITWLREPYRAGKTLIALNTPHSQFSAALGLTSTLADLDPDVVRDHLLSISLHRLEGERAVERAETYDQFDQMLTVVHDMVRR